MVLFELIAKQLSNPSGIVGHLVAGPLWNRRNAALNDAAFDRLALCSHDRVLEVGFGGGYLLGRMSAVVTDGYLAGVDVSAAIVRFCRRRYRSLIKDGRLEIKRASAGSLPYPSGHFSKVCTVNSIFYWPNVPRALVEFGRVLAQGGLLVMCFTCKESLAGRGFARHGVMLYEADEVEQMMASSGFHDIQTVPSSDKHRRFLCMSGRR